MKEITHTHDDYFPDTIYVNTFPSSENDTLEIAEKDFYKIGAYKIFVWNRFFIWRILNDMQSFKCVGVSAIKCP